MGKLRELLDKLPDLVKPLADVYVDMLERESRDQAEIFVRLALSRGWEEAHKAMLSKLSTQEIIDEQDAANEIKHQLNQDNAVFLKLQEATIVEILLKVLTAVI